MRTKVDRFPARPAPCVSRSQRSLAAVGRSFRRSTARLVAWLPLCLFSGAGIGLPIAAHPAASHATETTTVDDIAGIPPEKLGVVPIPARRDDRTGFVVGGKNSTESLRRLTELNGRSIKSLEADMRPGAMTDVGSDQGFLGPTESLLEVLAEDNRYVVDERRLDHQTLGRHLRVLAAVGVTREGREFLYHGVRYRVEVVFSRGYQRSPFRDGDQANADVVARNLSTGATLSYSLLVPLMIERYGFYEGRGTPYRVEPAKIAALLSFLKK